MHFSLSIVTSTSSQNPVNPPPLPLGQTQVECVTNLTINKFTRHPSDNWKVVVSGPDEMTQKEIITYEANTPNKFSSHTYNWILGNESLPPKVFADKWNVTSIPVPDKFKLKGNAYIPYNKLPAHNEDFGDTHGDVTVIEDNKTPGAVHKGVQVFFRKDDNNFIDPDKPNWFFYWSQIPLIQDLLQLDGMYLYDIKNCKFNDTPTPYKIPLYFDKNQIDAVITKFPCTKLEEFKPPKCVSQTDPKKEQKVIPSYSKNGNQIRITVGELAGEIHTVLCPGQEQERKGIHAFYNTIAHEAEHVKLKFEIWNYTHPSKPEVFPGYNDIWDMDRDYYKDIWEEEGYHPNLDFTSDFQRDNYNGNYITCYCTKTCSVGTMYEEERCRKVANELDYQAIDIFDWSYDLYLN